MNETVDDFLLGKVLKRVLAQVDIAESNSRIESWWRNLKHSWLFLNTLDARAAAFYVKEYNEVMPHGALDWRTPDEVYFGRAEDVPSRLETARRNARDARLIANREMTCEACRGSPASATAFSEAA